MNSALAPDQHFHASVLQSSRGCLIVHHRYRTAIALVLYTMRFNSFINEILGHRPGPVLGQLQVMCFGSGIIRMSGNNNLQCRLAIHERYYRIKFREDCRLELIAIGFKKNFIEYNDAVGLYNNRGTHRFVRWSFMANHINRIGHRYSMRFTAGRLATIFISFEPVASLLLYIRCFLPALVIKAYKPREVIMGGQTIAFLFGERNTFRRKMRHKQRPGTRYGECRHKQ